MEDVRIVEKVGVFLVCDNCNVDMVRYKEGPRNDHWFKYRCPSCNEKIKSYIKYPHYKSPVFIMNKKSL